MAYTEIDRKLILGVLQNMNGVPESAITAVGSTLDPMEVSIVLNELLQNNQISATTFTSLQSILMGVGFDLGDAE